mgnify:CR=1 FL=1
MPEEWTISTCPVCRCPKRAEIDKALQQGAPLQFAQLHGLSRESINCHKQVCLRPVPSSPEPDPQDDLSFAEFDDLLKH